MGTADLETQAAEKRAKKQETKKRWIALAALAAAMLAACGASTSQAAQPDGILATPSEEADFLPYKDGTSGKWGYMDSQGNVKIQPKYDRAWFFSENTAVVMEIDPEETMRDHKYGYIDPSGEVIIPLVYDFADSASDGVFRVLKEHPAKTDSGTWFYLDRDGNTLLEVDYWRTNPYSEGLSAVASGMGSKYGFIDIAGKFVIPPQYGDAGSFSEGLAFFCEEYPGGKYGYINNKNEVAIKAAFDFAKGFSEGFAAVQKGGKWGFIDKKGKTAIPFKFEDAGSFSEGVAGVKENGLCGVIGYNGEYIIPPQYPNLSDCHAGSIMVCEENYPYGFFYYINLQGDRIEPKDKGDLPNSALIWG